MFEIRQLLYNCYLCNGESLKPTTFQDRPVFIYRTDGSIPNHPGQMYNYILYCPHCEKFVFGNKLKKGRYQTSEEKESRINPNMFSFYKDKKKISWFKKI